MTLVGDGVALFEAQVVDALDQVHLLVGVVVGELIVVGVVEGL